MLHPPAVMLIGNCVMAYIEQRDCVFALLLTGGEKEKTAGSSAPTSSMKIKQHMRCDQKVLRTGPQKSKASLDLNFADLCSRPSSQPCPERTQLLFLDNSLFALSNFNSAFQNDQNFTWRINIGNESWFLSSETSDLSIFQEKCPEGSMSGEEWEWENAHFYFNINRFVNVSPVVIMAARSSAGTSRGIERRKFRRNFMTCEFNLSATCKNELTHHLSEVGSLPLR